jgi:hypothetical protein
MSTTTISGYRSFLWTLQPVSLLFERTKTITKTFVLKCIMYIFGYRRIMRRCLNMFRCR